MLESGEPREVHHFCLLLGYGAQAIRAAYTLPESGEALQAVRARWRNGGTALPAGTCTSPSGAPFDDWDDLVFAVSTVPP